MPVTELDDWLVGAEFHCVNCLYLRHSVPCQTQSSDDVQIVSAWYRESSHFWDPFMNAHWQPAGSRLRLKCDGTYAETKFIFSAKNGLVPLNRQGRQFGRILAAEVCSSAVIMLDTPCSVVVWRVLTTHSIRQFPLSQLVSTTQRGICTYRSNYLPLRQGSTADLDSCFHYSPTYHE
jgi:hypothetical protein